jgi:transcriptional antiterminator
MDSENTFIKPLLAFYFGKGKSEVEAHEEIVKQYGPLAISLKKVNKWYMIFRSKDHVISTKKPAKSKKHMDDTIINLINDNPEISLNELATLTDTSNAFISRRLRYMDCDHGTVNQLKTTFQMLSPKPPPIQKKFTDEFLINLINENPGLSAYKLAELANCSRSTILARLKQINSSEERVKYNKKNFRNSNAKFTDELLINLINENPYLNMKELGELTDTTASTISLRIKRINSSRSDECKITLQKLHPKARELAEKFTDEFLIKLVNENSDLTLKELAELIGTKTHYIKKRLNQINSEDVRVKYLSKKSRGVKKFTDEFLIDLINRNPGLNIKELAELSNTCSKTISRRLQEINDNREDDCKITIGKTNSEPKERTKKFTDEFLINLINENPGLSMKEYGLLSGTTHTTVSRRLKQINSKGEKANILKKTLQTEHLKKLSHNNC